ncbi:MAG TPA: XkdF-like putative serine protease domain-containing protein [Acidimicrobiales bacterium]|nr:XkdF-like putative serine protease domain-containing protein [Acidimicrobiales bacterium]
MSPTCSSCGCGDYNHRHKGSRSIVWSDITDAADDAGITPERATENMLSAAAHEVAKAHQHVAVEVFKSADESQYTLGVAYPANRPDVGKAADGFQDFASVEVLEKAAWSFMKNGGRIGLDHRKGTDGAGTVVESYIYRGPDWPQENGYVVKAGDWLLGVVWDEPSWVEIKSGSRTGFSPQGGARRRMPTAESLANLRR